MSERNVRLLSSDEQQRCYALPQFTETERDHYFTLLPAEKLHFDGLRNTATRVHFMLQLAYFKCKRRLFGFTLTSVKNDIAYNRQRHFQDQPARAMTLPSRETMGRNNRHILRLYDYSNSRKDAQTLFVFRDLKGTL